MSLEEVTLVANETKAALQSKCFGIDATQRFSKNSPSAMERFYRGVARQSKIAHLHLGRRTSPTYWVIERAAIVYINNAMRISRAREMKADRTISPVSTVNSVARPAPGESPASLGMVPLTTEESGFDFANYDPGAVFAFLPPEQARISNALTDAADCSGKNALDALCHVTPYPDRESLHGHEAPTVDFMVVTIVRMNGLSGNNVLVPWKDLYPSGPAEELSANGWRMKPGQ